MSRGRGRRRRGCGVDAPIRGTIAFRRAGANAETDWREDGRPWCRRPPQDQVRPPRRHRLCGLRLARRCWRVTPRRYIRCPPKEGGGTGVSDAPVAGLHVSDLNKPIFQRVRHGRFFLFRRPDFRISLRLQVVFKLLRNLIAVKRRRATRTYAPTPGGPQSTSKGKVYCVRNCRRTGVRRAPDSPVHGQR